MIRAVGYLRQYKQFQRNARLYLLAMVIAGLAGGMVLTIQSLYFSALGYGTDFIGVLILAVIVGSGITLVPAGLCVDRFSGKTILIWSKVLLILAAMVNILLRDATSMCVSAFFIGIGSAFVMVLHGPFLTRNSTPDERVHLFGMGTVLGLVTAVLGEMFGGVLPLWLREHSWAMLPQLSWLLAPESLARSYQITLLLSIIFVLPAFIPFLLMTDDCPSGARVVEKQSHLLRSEPKKMLLSLLKRFKSNKAAVTQQDTTSLGFWQNARSVLFSPLAMVTSVSMLANIGAGLLSPYFSLFFVQQVGMTSALFGLVDGIAQLMSAVGILLAPWLVTRVGRITAILLPRLLAIPLLLCIAMPISVPLVAILHPLRQFMSGLPIGLWQAFSMEVLPNERRGLANSSYLGAGQLAWAVAAPAGGVMIHKLGYIPVFWMTALCSLLAVVLFWWRFGGKRFATTQEQDSQDAKESVTP
ncbi:MAG: MFS transporter [Chloroflexi bacterium]|nr:MAG: MFS transporter [Chloroflexota bacterium]